MNTLINVSIIAVLAISLVMFLHTGTSNSFGQMMNQTNQTGGKNTTQQAQLQLEQTNQTQQQQQSNQTKQQDPKMNEKLLNFTNAAILALNDDDTAAAQPVITLEYHKQVQIPSSYVHIFLT